MNKVELLEFLKENLTIKLSFDESYAPWDNSSIEVSLELDGETISTSTESLPTWERRKSDGYY